ncbi:hypothetical protein [Peijinzhouia sedimentorum]
MTEHSKEFKDKEEFRKASLALNEYQRRHNIIRKDYELLLEITETFKGDNQKFNTQFRAALKGFFSLVESDIFGLNQIDSYEGYSDKDSFEDKFKKTLKQICKTWNKEEIIQKYLDSKYKYIKIIKIKRDKLIHPKSIADIIIATDEEFQELKIVFDDYVKMLHSIMNNFFIRVNIKDIYELEDIFKQ